MSTSELPMIASGSRATSDGPSVGSDNPRETATHETVSIYLREKGIVMTTNHVLEH